MDQERINEIKALLEGVTAGEWEPGSRIANARFIAASRQIVPELLEEVERLREASEMAKNELLTIHLQYGDEANALSHSAALRKIYKVLGVNT